MTTNPRPTQTGAGRSGSGDKDGKSSIANKADTLTTQLGVSPIKEEIKEETSVDESWGL